MTEMNGKCCIKGCQNILGTSNYQFFSFPTNPNMLAVWQRTCQLSSNSQHICSEHFDDIFIDNTRETLSYLAVPNMTPSTPITSKDSCRICARKRETFNCLFAELQPIDEPPVTLAKIIHDCTGVLFMKHETDRTKICDDCFAKVLLVNALKTKICESNKLFDSRIQDRVKWESEQLIDEGKHSPENPEPIESKKMDSTPPFKCSRCESTFSLKFNLRRHFKTHTDQRNYACNVCGRTFTRLDVRNNHMRTHDTLKYHCKVCKEGFRTRADVIQHRLDAHQLARKRGVAEASEKIACTVCNRLFLNGKTLAHHMNIHVKKDQYLCAQCGQVFLQKPKYTWHMKKHEHAAIERKHECRTCHKRFQNMYVLTRHQLVHTDSRPHACHVCAKAFRQTAHLQRHLRMHADRKTHRCRFCDKAFVDRAGLIVHERIHTRVYPFQCDVCALMYRDKGTLRKHRLTHLKAGT